MVLRGDPRERSPSQVMTSDGRSYIKSLRRRREEKADLESEDLFAAVVEQGSKGADNSCLCKAAPECMNMLLLFVLGKDVPRARPAF